MRRQRVRFECRTLRRIAAVATVAIATVAAIPTAFAQCSRGGGGGTGAMGGAAGVAAMPTTGAGVGAVGVTGAVASGTGGFASPQMQLTQIQAATAQAYQMQLAWQARQRAAHMQYVAYKRAVRAAGRQIREARAQERAEPRGNPRATVASPVVFSGRANAAATSLAAR